MKSAMRLKLLTLFTSVKLSVQSLYLMQTLNVILGMRFWNRARDTAHKMMMMTINQAATGVMSGSVQTRNATINVNTAKNKQVNELFLGKVNITQSLIPESFHPVITMFICLNSCIIFLISTRAKPINRSSQYIGNGVGVK